MNQLTRYIDVLLLAAVPACTPQAPIDGRACPCVEGWICCDADNICIKPGDVCTPSPTTLATGQGSIFFKLAVDQHDLYWNSSALMQIAKDGSPPIRESQVSATTFGVDANGGVWYVAVDPLDAQGRDVIQRWRPLDESGDVQNLAVDEAIASIAVSDSHVVWSTDDGLIRRRDADSLGDPVTIASDPAPIFGPMHMAIRGDVAYWSVGRTQPDGSPSGAVRTVSLAGGPVTTLAGDRNSPDNMVVDDDRVYWIETVAENASGGVTGAVMSVPRTGGVPTRLATISSYEDPSDIAVDDSFVYYVDEHIGLDVFDRGTVMKVPKSGGASLVLAVDQGRPYAIAVDDSSVYWATALGGAIRKAPK